MEGMRQRNYTAGERAVCIVGVLSAKSLMEINERLRSDAERSGATLRTLPESSYDMLRRKYAPALAFGKNAKDWDEVWQHMTEPKSLGDL